MLSNREPVTIYDVRSSYAYQMEHIQGALSLPLENVKTFVSDHPSHGTVVTYCSCPHHLAQMAADIFMDLGYKKVLVLDEGLPGWKRNGYPLVGTLANQPLSIFWVIGYVRDDSKKPVANASVRIYQPETDQLEIGDTGKDGFYALQLHFYGLKPGDQLQAALGKDTVFFTPGPKQNPWGTQIDNNGALVDVMPEDFLSLYKKKKLHL